MTDAPHSELIGGSAANELSAQRTAMSFERTAMSTDRTLMSVSRTSLSLIGFGFTIFQFFRKVQSEYLQGVAVHPEAPRRFGMALISIGIVLLILGIFSHVNSTRRHKIRRERLLDLGLLHVDPPEKLSPALIVSILLLFVGLFAIAGAAFRIGPL